MRAQKLSARLLLSHVLVAVLTCLVVSLLLVSYIAVSISGISQETIAQTDALPWLFGYTEAERNEINSDADWVLVLSPAGQVDYATGETPCEAGQALAACAPELAGATTGETALPDNRVRVVQETVTGHVVLSERAVVSTLDILPSIFLPTVVITVLSIPLALLLARLASGNLSSRLGQMTRISQAFAAGDFRARVSDPRHDDIGQLAQQFDTMADVLEKNMAELRDLARYRTEAVEQAERAAVQAERLRLSRDLHDSISQQLFSLSLRLDALPGVLKENLDAGVAQVEQCAALAGQTLTDLRTLLVDLRPTTTEARSLSESLSALCTAWSQENGLPVTYAAALTGAYIPIAVQNAVQRITQEALTNVLRHAQASEVTVSLLETNQRLTLSITDNGRGFRVDDVEAGHFGLATMRERARLIGGDITIESAAETGTTVRLVAPLQRNEHNDD